jgi:predicted nucleotidyltransferase component of viral defense system
MITRDEIDQKGRELQVNTANVERDYVFGWLLAGIFTATALRDVLILKGGNCLRKAYFEHARFSSDLDFSTQSAIDPSFLERELKKACDFVHDAAGVVFDNDRMRIEEKRRIDKERQVYEGRLYFQDFYGTKSTFVISIKMDVTQFDKIYLPIQTRNVIHPYSDYADCKAEIRCIKLEETLGTKLKCLLQRRHIADLLILTTRFGPTSMLYFGPTC